MKRILFVFIVSITIKASAQECKNCGERTAIGFHKIEWLGIQKPEDPVMLGQWEKLNDLWPEISYKFYQLFKNDKCLVIDQVIANNFFTYNIFGIIVKSTNDYFLKLWIQPVCSNKILAETAVHFQIYPVMDVDRISQQAVAQFGPLLKVIDDFEVKERNARNYGLGGDLLGGQIMITMDNKMAKGEETRVVMKVLDCDGTVLNNKEITTKGTSGGIFTPSKFMTDAEGTAIVKFKMLTDKTAIVKASCETKNVWGCTDLYTGSEVVEGIGGLPVKVSIHYEENETRTMKRATLPGIKIKGGEEAEMIKMEHRTVLYYFPSKKNLEEGILVDAQKIEIPKEEPHLQAKTVYVTESGWFYFTKTVQNAHIMGMAGNIEMVVGEEKGEETSYYGEASLQHPSEVIFHLGNQNEPPSFIWNVQYPASDGENMAGSSALFIKGEEGVKWEVNKITDPKSIYKTEYNLSLTLDAAEELKKGNKAGKELFGFDVDDLTKILDPTNPQSNMAGASGKQTITVRILSPYEETKTTIKK